MDFRLCVASLSIILLLVRCDFPGAGSKITKLNKDSVATVNNLKPVTTDYYLLSNKDSIRNLKSEYNMQQLGIILDVNRTDADHILKMAQVLVPANLSGTINQYSPFPQNIPYPAIKKIIFFSYPAEYFAAYENGRLVRSGPTNMGTQKDPTAIGLFYTTWKAEDIKSTFNDEWDLKWNFNIMNKAGVGFHQYALPGYPASHSCLRLQEDDAKFLYSWAEEWKLKGKEEVIAKGTPVIIFGNYPFGSAKPWIQLSQNPHALDITVAMIKQLVDTNLSNITMEQSITDKKNTAAE